MTGQSLTRIMGSLRKGKTKTAKKKSILFKIYPHLKFSSNLLRNFYSLNLKKNVEPLHALKLHFTFFLQSRI